MVGVQNNRRHEEDCDIARYEELEDEDEMGDVGSEEIHLKGVRHEHLYNGNVAAPANFDHINDESDQDITEMDQAPTPSRLTQKPHQPVENERGSKKSEIFSARSINKGKVRSRDRYKKYGRPE